VYNNEVHDSVNRAGFIAVASQIKPRTMQCLKPPLPHRCQDFLLLRSTRLQNGTGQEGEIKIWALMKLISCMALSTVLIWCISHHI